MEIKNCNCGGEYKLFIHTLPIDRNTVYYTIYCKNCGISTPSSTSLREVIEIWNNVMGNKYKFIPYSTDYNITNTSPNISFSKTFTLKDNE